MVRLTDMNLSADGDEVSSAEASGAVAGGDSRVVTVSEQRHPLDDELSRVELTRLRSPWWSLLAIVAGVGPLIALAGLVYQQRAFNGQQIKQDSLHVQEVLFEVIKDLTTATTLAAKVGAVARLKPIWQQNPPYRALFAASALVIAEEDDIQVRNEIRSLLLSKPDVALIAPIAEANRSLQQRIERAGVSSHLVWPTSDTVGLNETVQNRWRLFDLKYPKAVKLDDALRWNIDLLIDMLAELPQRAEGATLAANRSPPIDLSGVQLSRLVYRNDEFGSGFLPRDVTRDPVTFPSGSVNLARAYIVQKTLVGLRDTLTLDSALVSGTVVRKCRLLLVRALGLSVELGGTDSDSRHAQKGWLEFSGCDTIHFHTLVFRQVADEGNHVLKLDDSMWTSDSLTLMPRASGVKTCRVFSAVSSGDGGVPCK
jgi:hypothetical protein